MPIPSIAITTGLIGSGVLAWTFTARSLVENHDLDIPLNPLGINRSPYGEVFAMAMQGPIDTNFSAGFFGGHSHVPAKKPNSEPLKPKPELKSAKPIQLTPTAHLRNMLAIMDRASEQRTNPRPSSKALKFYLRRQAEDKLRFAHQLDPAHYANYNSLHFFLIEGLTTRPELTPTAAKLAEETIEYCLKQENDPRPALTAAAACTNILHLMFAERSNTNESSKFTTAQMRECMKLLDHCLSRYNTIATQWDESQNWELLSPMRITECEDRFQFISKIREAADKTILRYETLPNQSQTTS